MMTAGVVVRQHHEVAARAVGSMTSRGLDAGRGHVTGAGVMVWQRTCTAEGGRGLVGTCGRSIAEREDRQGEGRGRDMVRLVRESLRPRVQVLVCDVVNGGGWSIPVPHDWGEDAVGGS